jgi:hypothetical protein
MIHPICPITPVKYIYFQESISNCFITTFFHPPQC